MRTWIVSSVLFHDAWTFCSAASALLTAACRAISSVDMTGVRALAEQEQNAPTLSRMQDDLHV